MKRQYTIQDIARLIGISADAIRLYEKEGLISPDRDPQNGYRYYAADDIQRIMSIHLYRQINASIPEIKDLFSANSLPEVSDYFSSFIARTENEITTLQQKLTKLRYMKRHMEDLNAGLNNYCIKELPSLYIVFQQDTEKTLYDNMRQVFNSPVFSYGNFCYTLQTNRNGTFSPHALEFIIREPMMKVCPWNEHADVLPRTESKKCIYSVIVAPDYTGKEWDLSPLYAYAKECGYHCTSDSYAFYIYSLLSDQQIIDFYEIYIPILE